MTPILLLKVTLLLTVPLACLPLMRRASPAMRHLICAFALGGTLVLPFVHARVVQIPATFEVAAVGRAAPAAASFPWFALWMAGTALLLVRLAIGYWRVGRVVRNAVETDGYSVADVSVPLVTGLFRPVILMPRSAESWTEEQLFAAVEHELAHIGRKDLWTNLMAHIACAVYWFHPLVWMVARQMRREQERACDDAVIHSGFEPVVYAEALVAAARHFTSSTSLIGCHMLSHKTLKHRIARLLDGSLPRISSSAALRRVAVVLAIALGCMAVVNAADDQVYKIGNGVSAPRLVQHEDPSYTEEARAAKISGSVQLSLIVGTDGVPHDINVVRGLDAGLDVKAVEAVQKWRFEPGTKDGAPVAVKANVEINFKLL